MPAHCGKQAGESADWVWGRGSQLAGVAAACATSQGAGGTKQASVSKCSLVLTYNISSHAGLQEELASR